MIVSKLLPVFWALMGLCAFCPVMQAGTITNYSAWDQSLGVGLFTGTSHDPFSSYASWGETFQASASNFVLNSVTFYIDNSSDSPINFFAEVNAWNGQALAGPALFVSSTQTLANSNNGYQVVTVPTGNVVLTPGSEYIAFFSTIGLSNTTTAEAFFGAVTKDTVANSNLETNIGTTPTSLYQGNWSSGGVQEIAFTFQFNTVPEPSTWAMLGLGTVGTGIVVWRRRRVA